MNQNETTNVVTETKPIKHKKRMSTHNLATMAILAAIAAVLFMLEIVVFPAVPFYKLDFSNLPVLLGAFAMGPFEGVLILAIKAILGLLHTTSGGVGELADFIVGTAMVVPAGLIYHRNKSRFGALTGMLVGTICAVLAAILANYFIMFPAFGITEEALVGMGSKMFAGVTNTWTFVFYITALFNLIKFVAISVVGYLIYKPLSPILHGRKGR
ncbi:MAG: ECF transporter S component [Clostridia bacterium]|nr:ECF transporter S component [Clostridia bacterium]MBP3650068.1 ECF transporter S component [Clostridia bacterium]